MKVEQWMIEATACCRRGEQRMNIFDPVGTPLAIRRYIGYEYQHLDELRFAIDAEVFLQGDELRNERIQAARARLTELGWEGDGRVEILWIPPFLEGPLSGDNMGFCVWHVKQSNNGTSFLLSPYRFGEAEHEDSAFTNVDPRSATPSVRRARS